MKGKKATILILAMFLGLSVPAALSESNKFSVDYVFELVGDEECPGCSYWTIEDTQLLNIPGAPLVPYRAASILLPQNTQLKDVRIKDGKPIVQSGFDLPWGQPPCTFSDTPVKVGRDEAIYGSDNLYPNKLFDIVGTEYCKGFAILNLLLYPIQYQPKSGTIHFYEKLTVEVQVSKGTKNALYRGLADNKADVSSIVDNPGMISTYEDGPAPLATEEYIIITNDTMQSTFQTLATHKAAYVNGATVYTVAWITANYTGTDNQMKIRNFIIDKYTNNGTKYVLLGGDVSAVPYRGFYVSTGGYTDSDMLADMYYGHLDGTHNADGDSYYGETTDSVDWYAEVAVGRAPVDNTTEASAFVNKVINYELATKIKKVILHQSRVQAGNSPDSTCLAYGCDDYIPTDYTINYLFEETATVTKTSWINAWAADAIAVAHIGHGNTDVYYINYENGGTISWYNSDVASLTNTFWPWTTSVACITGQIEASDCLSEAYVKDPDNGAIAAIYNDNYGWFSTLNACQYSGEFCINEFRACWSDGKQKFGDMLNQARSYLASSASSDTTYRWCFYERNLVGDPESPSLTKRGPVGDTVTITYPSNGATVAGTVNITASSTGCIDTVEFYIDSTLKSTDAASPFSYSWNTLTYSEGSHTIEVKGYCSGVYKDNDTITVTVDNVVEYTVTITNPTDGSTVSGTVTCAATSNCTSVKWYIDGTYKAEDTSSPFQYSWDTTAYSNENHTVRAEGYVAGVYKDNDIITVTVDNNGYYVTITNPAEGQTVSDTVTCAADSNCSSVKWYIDGTFKLEDTSAPFQYSWDTTAYSNENHTVRAEGYVAGVYKAEDSVTCNVFNPYVRIVDPPQPGETVSCTVNIDVKTAGVDTVEFYLDGALIYTDTAPPFQYIWDTCLYLDGNHTIEVKGYASGVLKDTDVAVYQIYHYYVRITSPQQGETVSGTRAITVDANCVDTVELYIDDVLKHTEYIDPPEEGRIFEYQWDTCLYSNGPHTIKVKGYRSGDPKSSHEIQVQTDNGYIEIDNPQEGQIVSGTIPTTIALDPSCGHVVNVVVFYIDGKWLCTDRSSPFECEWDTCLYQNGSHIITAWAYGPQPLTDSGDTLDFPLDSDTVTVQVSNPCIISISPQGGEVYGEILISVEVGSCVDTVEFYIDGAYKDTDFLSPFEYLWNTFDYAEDQPHTILAEAYYSGILKCTRTVTVIVNNYYVRIISPQGGETISGTYVITVDARGVDEIQLCHDKYYMYTIHIGPDDQPPYECSWDTTEYPNGPCTLWARGFVSKVLKSEDSENSVNCTISNASALIFLGMFFGAAGIMVKRH